MSVKWNGLEELRQELRNLPANLTGEASNIVEARANRAAADILAGYAEHTVSGALQKGLTVTHVDRGRFVAGAIVKNRAPHASIFENGTQARHTALGANRGAMPPGHVFVPAVVRQRRAMYEDLKALLVRHGLRVSGDA